jgi:pyrroloquinoline quinone (PQQ) biosynthesis protein C
MHDVFAFLDDTWALLLPRTTFLASVADLSCPPSVFRARMTWFAAAVEHWSSLLAQLLARATTVEQRRLLLANLNEENGDAAHVDTYRQFLEQVGASTTTADDLATTPPPPLINILADQCRDGLGHGGLDKAASAAAAVEYLYVKVSMLVVRYVHDVLGVEGAVVHFEKHEAIDVDHAQDLLQVCTQVDVQALLTGAMALTNEFDL